jgi:dipeptidyl-peptidase-4
MASTSATPPTLSLCMIGGECRTIWRGTTVPGHVQNPAIMLTLKAADGVTTLYASLILPLGSTGAASVPLINNPYGGPGTATVVDRWGGATHQFDELLAEHGFAVLHVDNRGMGLRGRTFEQAAYRDFGRVQLADQLAAIDQVLAKYPQLDAKRLGWWGWSWGGSFTLNALTHTDRFRAGVSVAPVTDMRNYDSIYTERYLGLPAENVQVYDDAAVLPTANKLKAHLLLVHGTGDDNVHLENTIQYVQKLIDAQIPYDLQLYPRKTHSIAGPEARTHLYTRIVRQFEMYLKPQPAM